MPPCRACGTENPPESRFCSQCGAPLESRPAGPGGGARRTVTVLFSDVVGSTTLGERLDSESLRSMMSRYFDEMRAVIERHGGTVEKFIGDAVMAVFGVPTVREDDALRAVRAAAEMQTTQATLNNEFKDRWGVEMQVRTGVNTGKVVVGDPTDAQSFVSGDAVNVAARLEQSAGAGEVLLGDTTYRLVHGTVEAEPLEKLSLKGKSEAVLAFRLVGMLDGDGALQRRLETPIVGREQELSTLGDIFDSVVSEGRCRLVSLIGDAGIGKTRLLREFVVANEERAALMFGRCLPYGDGITLWPLVEVVKQAASIESDESPDQARAKLEDRLRGADELDDLVERLNALVGGTETVFSKEETFWAVRRLLERVSEERPIVVVLDGLQWAEAAFLSFTDYLVGSWEGGAMLLVCVGRPEIREQHPDWPRDKDSVIAVALEPLSDSASHTLIQNILGAPANPDVLERVTGIAKGSPLFLEELVELLVDRKLVVRSGDSWSATQDLDQPVIPSSVEALLSAHVARLEPSSQALLECAAVAGSTFWIGALSAMAKEFRGSEVAVQLSTLVDQELIVSEPSTIPGEHAFRFQHPLMREVVYGGLLKARRAELHGRFAEWLERSFGERISEHEAVIGYHLEQAYTYRAEVGQVDDECREVGRRAGVHLAAAGQRALARGDTLAAVNLLERSVALLPEQDPERLSILLKLGIALAEVGELGRAGELLSHRLDAEYRERSFMVYRDREGSQRIFDLDPTQAPVTIGRRSANDVSLAWDPDVSREHASLEFAGMSWTVVDDGLSRNGTFVNGERIDSGRALTDGDVVRIGQTILLYRGPTQIESQAASRLMSGVTRLAGDLATAVNLSVEERRLLTALCAPLEQGGSPADDEQIAGELSVDVAAVAASIEALCVKLGMADLPEHEKRTRMAEFAMQSGLLAK